MRIPEDVPPRSREGIAASRNARISMELLYLTPVDPGLVTKGVRQSYCLTRMVEKVCGILPNFNRPVSYSFTLW